MTFTLGPNNASRYEVRFVVPAMVLVASAALYLLAREAGTHEADGSASLVLDYGRLVAETGIWLSTAWLGRRLLSAAILTYAARTAQSGRASLLVDGGSQLLIDIGGAIIFAAALLVIVAGVYHLPLGGLLATSGVVAAIIGFAIQRMIADVFSGLALNIEHPFAVGDWIETSSGVTGRVLDANWRAVHLATIEGRAVVIPNSLLANNQFINLNAPHRHFRLKKTLCLDYSVPSARVVPIFQAAMEASDGVLTEPKPIVLIDECNDRGVVYSLNFWVPDYPDSFPISRRVVVNALKFLDQDGLAPAYPKRDVAIAKAAPRQLVTRIDIPTVLGRIPLLRHLGPDALAMLERRAHVHEYPDARVLINEGDPGSSLFLVIAGLLEVSQRDASGRQRAVGRLIAGDVFGEISLLTGAPRVATITTLTPVTLIEIDKHHLQSLFDAHPDIVARLTDIEATRLLANRSALQVPFEEQTTIERIGTAEFLRQRILQFFGIRIG